MLTTDRYGLNMPEETDYALIAPLNANAEAIDKALDDLALALEAHNVSMESHADLRKLVQALRDAVADVYTKAEADERLKDEIAAHNTAQDSHPALLKLISDLTARVALLESFAYNDITANAHTITFKSLDGLVVTGVWNKELARLEC